MTGMHVNIELAYESGAMPILRYVHDLLRPIGLTFSVKDGVARIYVPGYDFIIVPEGETVGLSITEWGSPRIEQAAEIRKVLTHILDRVDWVRDGGCSPTDQISDLLASDDIKGARALLDEPPK